MALVRSHPFREIDRFFQQAFGGPGERSWGMPMDAYRKDDIPVAEHAKPRRIDVNVREGSATVASPRHPEAVTS